MRIIAVVTLLFLPGTFMATFFSAGFFNFFDDNQRQGQVVSKWIWLYFVLTGTTTIVVFVCWIWYSKRQNQEILRIIKSASAAGTESIQRDFEFISPQHLSLSTQQGDRSLSVVPSGEGIPVAPVFSSRKVFT